MTDLFRLTARVGDRFGGWEVGGSIDLIEIYRFPPSNLDFDPIWAILIKYFYILVILGGQMRSVGAEELGIFISHIDL